MVDLAVMLVRRADFFVFACLFQYLGIHRRDRIYELRRKTRVVTDDVTSVPQTIRRIEASLMEKSQARVSSEPARQPRTRVANQPGSNLISNLIINAKLRIKLSAHRKKLWETPLDVFTPGKYIAK